MSFPVVVKNSLLSALLSLALVSPSQGRSPFFASGPSPQQDAPAAEPAQADVPPIKSEKSVPIGGNNQQRVVLPATLTVSPDSSSVAYKLRYGKELHFEGYIVNGDRPVGNPQTTDPRFSPDSKGVAAVVYEKGWKLYHDRKYLKGYQPIKPVRFSPDGKRMVYLAQVDFLPFVVEGENPHAYAERILWDQLVFTADSSVLAYPAYDGRHWRMAINGDPGPRWDSIVAGPFVAKNGPRVLFVATRKGRQFVVDRHTSSPDDGFRFVDSEPVISDDGKAFFYWAMSDDQVWRLYRNHVPVPGYDAERPGELAINQDGSAVAAILKRNGLWHVVRDGKPGPGYPAIGKGSLAYSPDGERLAYAVKKPRGWTVVVDGYEHDEFTQLLSGSLRFSPDSKRLVYAALNQGQWTLIENGSAQQRFNKIDARTIAFSEDSKTLAYIATRHGRDHVVVNGESLGAYDHAEQITFSPKGSGHVAWFAMEHGGMFIVVDGMPSSEAFDELVPGAKLHFTSPILCHTAVMRRPGPTFWRIELRLSSPGDIKAAKQKQPEPKPQADPPSPGDEFVEPKDEAEQDMPQEPVPSVPFVDVPTP